MLNAASELAYTNAAHGSGSNGSTAKELLP